MKRAILILISTVVFFGCAASSDVMQPQEKTPEYTTTAAQINDKQITVDYPEHLTDNGVTLRITDAYVKCKNTDSTKYQFDGMFLYVTYVIESVDKNGAICRFDADMFDADGRYSGTIMPIYDSYNIADVGNTFHNDVILNETGIASVAFVAKSVVTSTPKPTTTPIYEFEWDENYPYPTVPPGFWGTIPYEIKEPTVSIEDVSKQVDAQMKEAFGDTATYGLSSSERVYTVSVRFDYTISEIKSKMAASDETKKAWKDVVKSLVDLSESIKDIYYDSCYYGVSGIVVARDSNGLEILRATCGHVKTDRLYPYD